MVVWSKVSQSTTSCLSIMPRFLSLPGHMRKSVVTTAPAVVSANYPGFLYDLPLACHDKHIINGRNSDFNRNPKFQISTLQRKFGHLFLLSPFC